MFEILVFIFGTIIGSFLNVVILRYGTGMGLGGRSMCASSGKLLRWFELVPIVSFLMQKGRSRHTGAKLSWQYPVVELLTGFLFVLSFRYALELVSIFEITNFLVLFVFLILSSCFLVLIAVYDLRHMIVPNEFVYPFILLAFGSLFISIPSLSFVLPSGTALLSGLLVALPFVLLWLVSKGRWMGFADAKIALAMGWFVGLSSAFAAVLISFWLGAIVGLVILFATKKEKRKNLKIPFAPFLLTGLILVVLYTIDILSFTFLLI